MMTQSGPTASRSSSWPATTAKARSAAPASPTAAPKTEAKPPEQKPAAPAVQASPAAQAQPGPGQARRGGTLRAGYWQEHKTLDPHLSLQVNERWLMYAVYNTLVGTD